MAVKLAILALLEAKPDAGADLGALLECSREIAVAEEGTISWYAFKIDETHYGVFDTFETEGARDAHITGEIPEALGRVAPELLATQPDIRTVDIVALK
jgi:quinol monooxygenase YgiN